MKAEDVRIILERTFQMPVSESDAQIILDKVLALQAAVKDAPMILTDTPRPWSEGDMQSRPTLRALDKCPNCNKV